MVPPETTRLSTAGGATSDYTARFSSINGNQPFSEVDGYAADPARRNYHHQSHGASA